MSHIDLLPLSRQVVWIGILSGVALLGMVGLAVIWYRRTKHKLYEFRGQLRFFLTESNRIKLATKDYSIKDVEPLGPQVEDLLRQLSVLDHQIREIHSQYGHIQGDIRSFDSSNWFVILTNLYRWYRIQRRLASLRHTIENSLAILKVTKEIANHLTRQGWLTACQAVETLDQVKLLKNKIEGLRQRRLQGQLIEEILRQVSKLDAIMAEIPPYFFTANEMDFSEQVKKDDVTRVCLALRKAQPICTDLLTKTERYKQQYQEAFQRIVDLRRAMSQTKRVLNKAPLGLAIDNFRLKADSLAAKVKELVKSLAEPQVEQLPRIIQEADQLQIEAGTITQQISRASELLGILTIKLEKLDKDLHKLADLLARLEVETKYPLLWGESRQLLEQIRKDYYNLLALDQPTFADEGSSPYLHSRKRPPEQVNADLDKAISLEKRCFSLFRRIEIITRQRDELIGIFASPALQQCLVWCRNIRGFLSHAATYDPSNWPNESDLDEFGMEISYVEETCERLVPLSRSMPIEESELPILLGETRHLLKVYLELRNRLRRIQKHWIILQKIEIEGRDKLATLKASLNQLEPILLSNPLLKATAADRLAQLSKRAASLSQTFNQRAQGSVEKKTRAVQNLIEKAERTIQLWVASLRSDLQDKTKAIAASLENLSILPALSEAVIEDAEAFLAGLSEDQTQIQVAVSQTLKTEAKTIRKFTPPQIIRRLAKIPLATLPRKADEEQVISQHTQTDSRQQLSSATEIKASGNGTPTVFSLVNLCQELKHTNQLWQEANAIQSALETIEKPIMAIYQKAALQREMARLKLAKARLLIPEAPAWPPTSVSLSPEIEQFKRLEMEWEELLAEATTALATTSRLGECSGGYQALADKLDHLISQTEEEQAAIRALQGELTQEIQKWQERARNTKGEPSAQHKIQQMLLNIEGDLSTIQQNYQTGSINYHQTWKELANLTERLKSFIL